VADSLTPNPPATDAPATNAPTADAPVGDAAGSDAQTAEASAPDSPVAEAPVAEAPPPVRPGTVLPEWLDQRADSAPIAQHRALPPMPALRIRMAWNRLRAQATEGDEVWSFVNPKNTWKRNGKRSGYALVRGSEIRASVVVLQERG
jgi:hypothetical protein